MTNRLGTKLAKGERYGDAGIRRMWKSITGKSSRLGLVNLSGQRLYFGMGVAQQMPKTKGFTPSLANTTATSRLLSLPNKYGTDATALQLCRCVLV